MGGCTDIPIGIGDLDFRIKDSCESAAEYRDSEHGKQGHSHGDQKIILIQFWLKMG